MLYAIVAVLVILADQLIKLYVAAEGFQPMTLIPGVLNMGTTPTAANPYPYVPNTGGAFGIFGGSIPTFWFIVIAGVFTVLVILALSTKFIKGFLARWSIVLVTAGGISNCIDRVINVKPTGHVVDMFQFTPKFLDWFPVFNLADVFISVFCIIFILAILFGRGGKRDEDYEDEFVEDEEEDLPEEEEEVRPARKSRKARKQDYDDYEDEEEEERRPKPERKGRKARQSRYDEEYEQYKAAQRAREEAEQPQPAAVVENPAYDPADPFAEWERANNVQPAPKPAPAPAPAPVQPEPAPQLIRSAPRQRPAAARSDLAPDPQYARPAQPEQPAPAPAPRPARKPAPAPVEEPESFSLDDILAEFK